MQSFSVLTHNPDEHLIGLYELHFDDIIGFNNSNLLSFSAFKSFFETTH